MRAGSAVACVAFLLVLRGPGGAFRSPCGFLVSRHVTFVTKAFHRSPTLEKLGLLLRSQRGVCQRVLSFCRFCYVFPDKFANWQIWEMSVFPSVLTWACC